MMDAYGFTTIADAYNHFEALHGAETPLRASDELRSLIHACNLRYEDVDGRFWNAAFDSGWAFAETADGSEFDAAIATYQAMRSKDDDTR